MKVVLMMSLRLTPPLSLLFLLMISVAVAQQQWSVSYTQNSICAVRGSTVTMGCSYKYNSTNSTVQRAFWSKKLVTDIEPLDLSSDQKYRLRVQYLREKPHDCSLRLKDVIQEDKGKYYFMFATSAGEQFQDQHGVELSVTGLRVEIPDRVVEGDEVTLTCKTTCSLTDTPTFTWYKNGMNLSSSSNPLRLPSVSQEDAGDYRCAVQGQTYRSPAVILDVQNHVRISPVAVGVVFCGVAALLAGLFFMRWKRQKTFNHVNAVEDTYTPPDPISRSYNDMNNTLANVHSSPTEDTYTALDVQATSSSGVYDTLANIYCSPTDDTYTALDLQTRSSNDTYSALDSQSISPDYYNLPTARKQQ
ncbi:sialoadhesin isoform X2 [Pangasianodon hypophthalmus]|uniref:sialoadhesin isoform X2 n=1 Tax=Pangasianodon hypophthalmus TaxID=310915 RepID=UPI000EFE7495|nr:sialoadhesin isoform X2 [Pangasianodon hypophthalmus]